MSIETFEYQGRARRVVGRLHCPEPPMPGAIVGPNAMGEALVVLGTVDGDTLIGYADRNDVANVPPGGALFAPGRQRLVSR